MRYDFRKHDGRVRVGSRSGGGDDPPRRLADVRALRGSQRRRPCRVGRRIDAMGMRIDRLAEGVNGRFDAVNDRIDGVNDRIDGVNDRIDRLHHELTASGKH